MASKTYSSQPVRLLHWKHLATTKLAINNETSMHSLRPLVWLLWLASTLHAVLVPSPVLATNEAGPVAVAQGPLESSTAHPEMGRFHLWRQGNTVVATIVATHSQWDGRSSFSLFTIPEGFRPATSVSWVVTPVQPVDERGYPLPASTPSRFTLQATPQGTVQRTGDHPDALAGYWRYTTKVRWTTAEPMLLMAGYFERRWDWPGYEKWEANKYRLKRLGSTVQATIRANGSQVDGEGLFSVPKGLRPSAPATGKLTGIDSVPYALRFAPDGHSTYVPLTESVSEDFITYRADFSWTTRDAARLEHQGTFLHQPHPGAGRFRLRRQGHTVLAQLSALATPVPPWFPLLHSPPQLSMDPDDWGNQFLGEWKHYYQPELRYVDGPYPGPQHPTYLQEPDIRYDIVGQSLDPPAWQIRFADDTVLWVREHGVRIHGDSHRVPVTNPLFYIPEGFRPGHTVKWPLKSQPVHADGQIQDNLPRLDLAVEITPRGRAFYGPVPVPEAGYQQFQATIAWPIGTDLCQRSQAVKDAVMDGVETHNCENVTWTELASFSQLEVNAWTNVESDMEIGVESFLSFDLMGLTGLRDLKVTHDFDGGLSLEPPPLFLSHVPQLERLVFRDIILHQVPEDFLVHTPTLQTLDLSLSVKEPLPLGFLAFTPRLRSLSLNLGQNLKELPPGFLADVPHLQHLNLALHGEALAQLPPDFLRDAPRLETLTLHVWGDGRVPLLPGFLSHAPRLQRAVIATERAQNATQQPLLVLEEPASFLAQAPQLQELWLHRVAAGSDFLDHLPDTARIHWVSWGSAPMPPAVSLAATAPQSWLYVRTTDLIPESWASVTESLNLVLSHTQSEIPQATITWLSEQRLRALILDLESHLDINPEDYHRLLEAFRAAQGHQTPRRVSLLLPRDDPQVLPRGLLSGYAYEWVYLKNLDMRTLPPTFFADVTATALLLEPGLHNTWHFPDLQLPLRHLLQASQVQHLGLILPSQLWLPAEALGNLDFVCLELDLTPLLHNSTFEDLQTFLEVENISLTWTARAAKADPTALRSWWQRTERRPQLAQPTWFESSHLPWAQERGCRRSLYLRMHGDVIVFAPHMLTLMGQLRHVRLTYNLADCPQCPHTPAGGR